MVKTTSDVTCSTENGFISKIKSKAMLARVGVSTAIMTTACAVPAFASDAGSGNGIAIDFDVSEMFKFANIIISSLMPVVYITAGLGIGFLIINSLKNAFR